MKNYHKTISNLRRKSGLTKRALAQAIQCNESLVSLWESKDRHPSPPMAKKLAEFFKVPIETFFILILLAGAAHADAGLDRITQTIIAAESGGNAACVGDHGKSRGLMQIKEGTWKQNTRIPWSRALDGPTNKAVGQAQIKRIMKAYQRQGIKPEDALIVWAYNTGRLTKHLKPGKWTTQHPNKIYRTVYLNYFRIHTANATAGSTKV